MLNNDKHLEEALGGMLSSVLQTAELKWFSGVLAGDILESWAGERPFRKRVSGVIHRRILNSLDKTVNEPSAPHLKDLFSDPDFVQGLAGVLPQLTSGVLQAASAFLAGLAEQPQETRRDLVAGLQQTIASSVTGEGVNALIRLLASTPVAENEDGETLKGFSEWLAAVDFGLIRQWLDGSEDRFSKLVQQGNDTLWQYPAKLVIVLSLLPLLLNRGLVITRILVSGFNQAPPDLIADIFNSLLMDIQPKALAAVINEGTELLRKVRSGGSLIGEPGSSKTSAELIRLFSTVRDNLDLDRLNRVKADIREEKIDIQNRMREALYGSPDQLASGIESGVRGFNADLNGMTHRLSGLLDLPDETFNAVIDASLDRLDRQEIADILEQGFQLLLRFVENRPHLLPELAADLLQQVDPYELQDLVSGLAGSGKSGTTDLARAVVPGLVTGVCEILAPRDDEFEAAASSARQALQLLLQGEEAQS